MFNCSAAPIRQRTRQHTAGPCKVTLSVLASEIRRGVRLGLSPVVSRQEHDAQRRGDPSTIALRPASPLGRSLDCAWAFKLWSSFVLETTRNVRRSLYNTLVRSRIATSTERLFPPVLRFRRTAAKLNGIMHIAREPACSLAHAGTRAEVEAVLTA
ncbi:hypothetical protein BC826DRAFT_1025724 [Russula brevipes]|nr:hypothetical protein BC826DRAFT_1025724 [Russula brevipes]